MYIIREYVIPTIVYPGTWIVSKGSDRFKIEGLLNLIEDSLNKAAYSISKYLIESKKGIIITNNEPDDNLDEWENRISIEQGIRQKYCQQFNVLSVFFLPIEAKKNLMIELEYLYIESGREPYFWNNLANYYANNFALAINEIVVGVSTLKEYKEIFIDLKLYYDQLNQLFQIVPDSKDIRDSISHAEDRVRGQARNNNIQVKSRVYDNHLIKSNGPAKIFFTNALLNDVLTYTNHAGKSSQMEISVETFKRVEWKVQEVINNISYSNTDHPRMMRI